MGTVQADTITDGAGTGAPNFSQGVIIGGGSTLMSYSTLSTTLNGDFTAGQIRLTLIGNVVTITTTVVPTHASLTTANSASGLISAAFRPVADATTNASSGNTSAMTEIGVRTDGTFRIQHRDWAGALVATTGPSNGLTISYAID